MPGSYFGQLKAHNHTATVGDGGVLSNLQVTGDVTATDDLIAGDDIVVGGDLVSTGDVSGANVHATAGIVDETGSADAANEVPRFDQMMVWQLLMGG